MHPDWFAGAIARRAALRPRTADELVAAFLLSKRTLSTREAYRRDLADFHAFLTAIGPGMTVLSVTRTVVEAYAEHLTRLGARRRTVARRLACLSSLYRRRRGAARRLKAFGERRQRSSSAHAVRATKER